MTILIASDIFGATPELHELGRHLPGEAEIMSPYAASQANASTEEEAYASFLQCGGLDAYTQKLSSALAELRPDALVAFSAGASAAWRALSTPDQSPGLGILFYGSRIRDYLSLRPTVPTKLIFAEQEKAFDVAPVVARLRAQGLDAVVMPGTRHGYMNARSPGFDPRAMQAGLNEVVALLSCLNAGIQLF
ncbi:dienelactone hydrolase family protein [Noviherbaspirillum agri]